MGTIAATLALLLLDCRSQAIASTARAAERTQREPPPAVRAFIDRRAACNHWSGEDAYDRDRAREIARAVRALHCDRLPRDEVRLRRRYRSRPDLLDLIRRTEQLDVPLSAGIK